MIFVEDIGISGVNREQQQDEVKVSERRGMKVRSGKTEYMCVKERGRWNSESSTFEVWKHRFT